MLLTNPIEFNCQKSCAKNFALVASKEFFSRNGYPKTPDELIECPAVVYSNSSVILDKIQLNKLSLNEYQQLMVRGFFV